jgi:hypothetical protein
LFPIVGPFWCKVNIEHLIAIATKEKIQEDKQKKTSA